MLFFFFNDTATTEIYTLSLHDALPISQMLYHPGRFGGEGKDAAREAGAKSGRRGRRLHLAGRGGFAHRGALRDRKSTRLNSSHANISYAVFCLKKKNNDHNSLGDYLLR